MADIAVLDIAVKAVRLYAESHPRPVHVTMKQAAEMPGGHSVDPQWVCDMIRARGDK